MESIIKKMDGRRHSLNEHVAQAHKEISNIFQPKKTEFDKALKNVLASNTSRKLKLIKLQSILSDVRALSDPYTACNKGCSNCCYQRVMLSQTEAEAIGNKINVNPVQLPRNYTLPDVEAFNHETPCTFLKNGSCSIYDYRPFMCRNQVNLDIDNTLCSFENWELSKVKDPRYLGIPMLSPGPLLAAYQNISGNDKSGDIRDYFPSF